MKLFLTLALVCFALLTTAQAQQEPDAKYIRIYGMIEQGEKLSATGQPGEAAALFTEAQSQLALFQRNFPEWNPSVVKYRLQMLTDRIAELKQVPAVAAGGKPATGAAPVAKTGPSGEAAGLAAELQAAQVENATLQAKLKEALSVQPGSADAGELARAQQQVILLMKENDLLKAGQRQAREKAGAETNTATTKRELAAYAQKYHDEQVRAEKLAAENEQFKQHTEQRTEELNQAKKDLDDYVKKYAAEQTRATQLAAENDQLRKQSLPPTGETVATLKEANGRLSRQLAALQTATTNTPDVARLTGDLKAAQTQIVALKGQVATLTRDKELLEIQTQKSPAPAASATAGFAPAATSRALPVPEVSPAKPAGFDSQIKSLGEERDELQKKLDAANRKLAQSKSSRAEAEIAKLNQEVDTLRAKVAVVEAAPVPLSAEELALFRQPPPAANSGTAKKSIRELPAGTAELVVSARQHFARQEFDQAEADYLKILTLDQNNSIALANLATIELQQGKLADAEKHLQTALTESPDDAYNLSTLGYLKFLQEKYDEALGILSRAAKIDPNNPEIQNYLGVTLSHKGMRVPAETALRKAIALAPNFAPAHNNLAVVYLTAEPTSPLLARWHYQKAVAAGQPRNPEFEKALADKGAPVEIQ